VVVGEVVSNVIDPEVLVAVKVSLVVVVVAVE
jgi:hypothetical protein